MQKREWLAFLAILAGAYLLVKRKMGAPVRIEAHYDPQAGWIDDTQSIQYDDQTGNLYDELRGSVWIGQVAPGQDASVFTDPNVQAMIQASIMARGS